MDVYLRRQIVLLFTYTRKKKENEYHCVIYVLIYIPPLSITIHSLYIYIYIYNARYARKKKRDINILCEVCIEVSYMLYGYFPTSGPLATVICVT